MKIIFLDIDGVLCTFKIHFANRDKGIMKSWDEVSCRLLERLLEETNSKLVISSTWRLFNDGELELQLKKYDFNRFLHQDKYTPSNGAQRGDEIKGWLANHPEVEDYLILDDSSDILEEQKPHFVRTHIDDGFGFHHYEQAIRILNKTTSNIIII